MRTLPQDDDLLAALLEQHRPRKKGCVSSTIEFVCTVAVVALAVVGGYFLLEIYVAAPAAPDGTVNSVQHSLPTYAPPAPRPPRQEQPVSAPLPDCSTVTNTTTACEQTYKFDPTPTATPEPPTPTAEDTGSFWTPAEQTAIAATEAAWYDPATLPTVEPAFATAVQAGCEDAAKRAQSPLLDSWCKPLDE